jgi:hypothetical protein
VITAITTPLKRVVEEGTAPEMGPAGLEPVRQKFLPGHRFGWFRHGGDVRNAADVTQSCSHVWAYRNRLLTRPSYARALDQARPYRHMFPLGAPEGRD